MLRTNCAYTFMSPKLHLHDNQSESVDIEAHRTLFVKLLYVIVTKPNICGEVEPVYESAKKVH